MKTIQITFLLSLLILASCANPQPPSGGPPDTTPPEITKFTPERGTIYFSGNSVSIQFNKYMDRNKVNESIFISPDITFESNWSGKSLEIEFKEPLDENTTYSVSLGTDFADLKGNKPTEAFTIIFSTGNKLDSGRINGLLLGNEIESAFIYAYNIDNINPDTLNIANTKPYYRTQVGSSGTFSFIALKEGNYRLYAVKDEFRDNIYSPGVDRYGTAYKDVFVSDTISPEIKLKLGPLEDIAGPELIEAATVTERVVTAIFSEPLARASVLSSSFKIEHKETGTAVGILSAFPQIDNMARIRITVDQPLDTGFLYKLIALPGEASVTDTLGNKIVDTLNTAIFEGIDVADTLQPELVSLPVLDSSRNITFDSVLVFVFNTGIINPDFTDNINLTEFESGANIPLEITKPVENQIAAAPVNMLLPDTWYRLTFTTVGIISDRGTHFPDTTYVLDFETASVRAFTSITGTLTDSVGCSGQYVVVLRDANREYKAVARGDSMVWDIDFIATGDYTVEIFCDDNKNEKYDYGNIYPFRHSEFFTISEKTISLKSRWAVEGVNFIVREK